MSDRAITKSHSVSSVGRPVAVIEPLEGRKLLAVDLTAAVQASTLPTALVVGTARKGTVTVLLGNADPVLPAKNTPKVDVEVRLVSDGSGGAPTSQVVGRVKNFSLAKLTSASAAKKLRVGVSLPRSFPAGVYSVQVVADPANKLQEAPGTQANNTATGTSTLTVAPPFSALEVSQVVATFPSQTPGSLGTATLRIRNTGNVLGKGTIDVSFTAVRPMSNDGIPLGDQENIRVSLAPGKESLVAKGLRLSVPENSSVNPVTFTVVATITPKVQGTDSSTRRSATAGTIALPGVPRSNNSPLINGLGSTLSFTATRVFDPGETGTVTDELGRTGTYTFVSLVGGATPDVLLVMTFPPTGDKPPFKSNHKFTSNSATVVRSLNGKSVTFGVPAIDAQGIVQAVESSGNTPTTDPGVTYMVVG